MLGTTVSIPYAFMARTVIAGKCVVGPTQLHVLKKKKATCFGLNNPSSSEIHTQTAGKNATYNTL